LHHAHSFSSLDKHLTAERERLAALHGEDAAGEDDLGVGDEEEPEELLNLDPKEWKVRLLSWWNFFCPLLTCFF
jgi:DnaJ family protein C protein 2